MSFQAIVDTDVLSMIMRRQPDVLRHASDYLREHGPLSFSTITAYEILRGLKAKNAESKVSDFTEFCSSCNVLPLTLPIVDVAATIHADLRIRGEILDHADILIAATAISENRSLATNNVKHFARISGLTLVDGLSR